jgi:hypothetical protein
MRHFESKNSKRRCCWKTGCCSGCNAAQRECLWVWRASALGALWVIGCLLGLRVRYRGWECGHRWREKWDVTHVAGISTFNKQQANNFAVVRNLFSRLCVRIFTFPKNCISQSYSSIHTVYIDQPTNQLFTPAQCSVSVTTCGPWGYLTLFIDVLCPTVHSWMLTAALLWCWKLTRPALCLICASLYRYGATDRRNLSVVSVGAEV